MEGGYIERSAVQLGNAVLVLEKGERGLYGADSEYGSISGSTLLPSHAD